jgi:hypothetical protein
MKRSNTKVIYRQLRSKINRIYYHNLEYNKRI